MHRTIEWAAALALALAVSGCASPEQQGARLAKQAELQRTIPTCAGDKECAAKWDAAQLWVVKNAAFKIQTATNVVIETFNSPSSSTSIAVRVIKEPAGAGTFRFIVRVWCGNLFGCSPDPLDAAIAFNRSVSIAE